MILLSINWAEVGIKAAQFVLSFSIIVVLHEMGHFFPARWFKCRVEKFYLFFNPWFSLWKKKIGETEWGIGWIPFGGYVKISGMIDESMDKEQLKQPPKPYEFRAKPAWQRLIIMIGGVIVNLLLGFLIYAMMLWHWGDEYVPTNKMKYGIAADSLAESIGLRDGDKLLTVDHKYIDKFRKVPLEVILKNAKTFQVERDGQQLSINIPDDFGGKLIRFKDIGFINPRVPTQVDTVAGKSPADSIGLKKGDRILAVDSTSTEFFDQFAGAIASKKGQVVELTLQRDNEVIRKQARITPEGKLGFWPVTEYDLFEKTHIQYGLLESFPGSWTRSIETLENYWLQLKLIFSGKVKTSESLGSVFSIANMFSAKWDWESFWAMTAFFSLVLALMNILPIPALDGGHALFTIIEMITGKKPNEKVIEYAQMAGMILLLGLMAYALGLDIFRIFK